MILTRAERELIRRRRRRHTTLAFAAVIMLAVWASAQQRAPRAHHRHRPVHHAASRHTRKRHSLPNGTARATGPTSAPGLRWSDFHGIALPTSTQSGPFHTSKGLAWGFADTRTGALLAAVNIAVRTGAQWGPAIFVPTIRHQVTGPATAALLAADTRQYTALRAAAHVPSGQPAGRGYAAEAAYRFATYSPTAATVDVVSEGPGTGGTTVMAVTRIRVLWQHGDWRVVAPPGGNWANSATAISSLTGYTAFPNEG